MADDAAKKEQRDMTPSPDSATGGKMPSFGAATTSGRNVNRFVKKLLRKAQDHMWKLPGEEGNRKIYAQDGTVLLTAPSKGGHMAGLRRQLTEMEEREAREEMERKRLEEEAAAAAIESNKQGGQGHSKRGSVSSRPARNSIQRPSSRKEEEPPQQGIRKPRASLGGAEEHATRSTPRSPEAEELHHREEEHEDDAEPEEDARVLKRTFSYECCQVLRAQNNVTVYDPQAVYASCEILSRCSPDFLREIVETGGATAQKGLQYAPGDYVYEEGAEGTSMFVIASGCAESTSSQPAHASGLLQQSDHFGAAQLLGVFLRRHESIRAKTYLQVLEVKHRLLGDMLKRTSPAEDVLLDTSNTKADKQVYDYNEERKHFDRLAVKLYLAHCVNDGEAAHTLRIRARRGGQRFFDDKPAARMKYNFTSAWRDKADACRRKQEDARKPAGAQEKLNKRLHDSLREDLKRGWMMAPPALTIGEDSDLKVGSALNFKVVMPSASPRKSKGEKRQSRCGWLNTGSSEKLDNMRFKASLKRPPKIANKEVQIEDAMLADGVNSLDLDLLPPEKLMHPMQKQTLARQLDAAFHTNRKHVSESSALHHLVQDIMKKEEERQRREEEKVKRKMDAALLPEVGVPAAAAADTTVVQFDSHVDVDLDSFHSEEPLLRQASGASQRASGPSSPKLPGSPKPAKKAVTQAAPSPEAPSCASTELPSRPGTVLTSVYSPSPAGDARGTPALERAKRPQTPDARAGKLHRQRTPDAMAASMSKKRQASCSR
eukprot:TRINITY_DN81281_c0_g1_i1.p1 TRINITY_DN81281_c0_g1~~TRINITY_DN81281_c0_g1_i1.p1  ORF type:complete len:772 (-),score=220.72 TRINITY_DN81281_c0_g1_i1:112-2427(-)